MTLSAPKPARPQFPELVGFANVANGHENGPRRDLRGPFLLVAGTGFEPAPLGYELDTGNSCTYVEFQKCRSFWVHGPGYSARSHRSEGVSQSFVPKFVPKSARYLFPNLPGTRPHAVPTASWFRTPDPVIASQRLRPMVTDLNRHRALTHSRHRLPTISHYLEWGESLCNHRRKRIAGAWRPTRLVR